MRNCTRDEGGPFGFGNQVLIPSHRRLLRSKAVVVSVAETPEQDFRQARSREASASEPLQKCRKLSSCHGRLGPPGGMKRLRWGAAGAEFGIALVQSSPWISLTGSLLSTRICRPAGRRPRRVEIS